MSVRRMVPFLLLNIVISATVVLGILYWWESRQSEQAELAVTRQNNETLLPTPTAELQLQITDTPAPTATEIQSRYVVQTGDTLGNIGDTFGVTVDDIMVANGILDRQLYSKSDKN